MIRGILNFFTLLFFFYSTSVSSQNIDGNFAQIQILDKVTAKVNTIEIQVSKSFKFQTLNIEIFACYKRPPEEIPENFVLIKIHEFSAKNSSELIYQGWMISSSPSTTPLEHPLYDLWLKDCKI